MTPTDFEGSNAKFGPPSDLEETQCGTIPAFVSKVQRGSCEGAALVVTAWKPTPDELRQLNDGNPVFLSCLGGLPPHFLTTNLAEACNPA
jgi:hypothetical protein